MMLNEKLLANRDNSIFCAVTGRPVTLAALIIPYGYGSPEMDRGYAHLIEHMVINCNQKYFSQLEKKGINYNAETLEDSIRFTFISFNSDTLENEKNTLGTIFDTEFTQESLDVEKKTIAQEYLYRSSTFTTESIDEALGSQNEISAFSLEKLNRFRKTVLKEYKVLYISRFPEYIDLGLEILKKFNIGSKWYENIVFSERRISDNDIYIKMRDDIYSELLAYNLNILCMCSFERKDIRIHRSKEDCCIELSVGKDEFLKILKDKRQIFARYVLFLDTIKVYYQSLASLIEDIGSDFDIKKCFFSDWEVSLLEDV